MPEVKNGDRVKIHVTEKLEDGTLIYSTLNHDPLSFTIGEGKFIRGLEEAVLGMGPGDKKNVKVSPENGFGPYHEDLLIEIDKKSIPPSIEPCVGQKLEMSRGDSGKTQVLVKEVSDTSIKVDANHPLAGKNLMFEIELIDYI
jgi:peptidylprolyl isomerase